MKSKITILICMLCFLYAGNVFYPKWKKAGTEATIGWDVSGYYMYLPATFIYQDLKQCSFKDEILQKYRPTPDFQQAYQHPSGNYVMKYSMGQAVQMLPFFLAAHIYAQNSDQYLADGFSRPYQFMIYLSSLFMAIMGLIFLRKILLEYFSDTTVALSIASIVLASNYLDYAGITGSMTHNHLFTIYTILIYLTIKYYKKPTIFLASVIGVCIGLAALTRPTEILSIIIPLIWGLKKLNKPSILELFSFHVTNYKKLILSAIIIGFIGSWQLIYWKYATGNWIVYSYEDQGFSWLRPHLQDGLFSYKSGWLTYSPVFYFSIIGFYNLYKNYKSLFWVCLSFCSLFVYVTFAWDIWWYGGSLGQRAMVQSYPLFAFPMAAFFQNILSRRKLKYVVFLLLAGFTYFNLWLTYQAHGGGLLRAGQMTKGYFWATILRYEKNEEDLKLLDNPDSFCSQPINVKTILQDDFEKSTQTCTGEIEPINGFRSLCIHADREFSPILKAEASRDMGDWARATATFRCKNKEWNVWTMAQFILKFYDGDTEIKNRSIRIFRLLHDGETQRIHIDAKFPKDNFTHIGVMMWNASGNKELMMDDLVIEVFTE